MQLRQLPPDMHPAQTTVFRSLLDELRFPVGLLQEIVSDAAERTDRLSDEISHVVALGMARSAAIPHGQVLSNDEMESVINRLFACSNVNYTPDGKPILCILPQWDIEQLLS